MPRLIVVSGPSGAGKTSIARGVAARRPDVLLSVSATTRAPRSHEKDGEDYFFLTHDAFDKLEKRGAFLETATVYGERYGTLREKVDEGLRAGRTVLLEIDVQGARSVRAALPEALLVFIEPPSIEVLRDRLTARRTEGPETLDLRLRHALHELEAASEFDYRIVNHQLESATEDLIRILDAVHEPGRPPRSEGENP